MKRKIRISPTKIIYRRLWWCKDDQMTVIKNQNKLWELEEGQGHSFDHIYTIKSEHTETVAGKCALELY